MITLTNGEIERLSLTSSTEEFDLELIHKSAKAFLRSQNVPMAQPPTPLLPTAPPNSVVCGFTGHKVYISLNQHFITADPQPVAYTMYAHDPKVDGPISGSLYYEMGNHMFEMDIKRRIYQCLRGTLGTHPRPDNPLYLDVGANIGLFAILQRACTIYHYI